VSALRAALPTLASSVVTAVPGGSTMRFRRKGVLALAAVALATVAAGAIASGIWIAVGLLGYEPLM